MTTAEEWMAEIDARAEQADRRAAWRKLGIWWLKFMAVVSATGLAAILCGWGLARIF